MWAAGEWLLGRWAAGNALLEELLKAHKRFEPVKYRGLLAAADGRLSDWDTLLAYIESEGYAPAAVRAVFEHHWQKLRLSQVGSDKHLVWLDFFMALPRCSPRANHVLRLLGEGQNTKELGNIVGGNGSRLVTAACLELSAALGEVLGGSPGTF